MPPRLEPDAHEWVHTELARARETAQHAADRIAILEELAKIIDLLVDPDDPYLGVGQLLAHGDATQQERVQALLERATASDA